MFVVIDKKSGSSVIFHQSGTVSPEVETMGVSVPGLQASLGYGSLSDEGSLLSGTRTAGIGAL